jgi:hypothetical protein
MPYNVKIAGNVTGGPHREFAMASGEMTSTESLGFNEALMVAILPSSGKGSNPVSSVKIYVSAITSGSAGEGRILACLPRLVPEAYCFDLRRRFAAHSPLRSVVESRSRLSAVRVSRLTCG